MRELRTAEDAELLLAVLNDPAFIANVGDRGVRTTEAAADYIRQRIAPSYTQFGFGMWRLALRATDEPIGICGLLKRDTLDDVDVGFSLLEAYRGSGYASEAAAAAVQFGWSEAQLARIVAITAPHNADSIRLLTKLGMQRDGTVRIAADGPELLLFAATRPPTG